MIGAVYTKPAPNEQSMPRKKKDFWNKEYASATHLAMSDEPAEDLVKFTRFLERRSGKEFLNVTRRFVDIGCGNGRNAIFLAREFGMHGLGYDTSVEAIHSARHALTTTVNCSSEDAAGGAEKPLVEFLVRDIKEPIPLPDESATIALDMMSSHYLKRAERFALRAEILRVLKPGGWLFFKTFLRDEDRNAEELLKEFPAEEEGMYLHPEIKKPEYVWWEKDIYEFFEPYFTIHKLERSHKHVNKKGGAWKRRTASVYLEKRP